MKKRTSILSLAAALLLPLAGVATISTSSTPSLAAKTPQPTANAKIDSLQAIADRAEQGDADAQNTVGIWYYTGQNFKQDYNKAVQWWLRAQKQGSPAASANLAKCYLRGHGVEVDSTRAASLVKLALKKGSAATLKEYRTLADEGDIFAARMLCDVYKKGLGSIKKNPADYLRYLAIVARIDDEAGAELARAQMQAGRMKEAYATWTALAQKGVPAAYFWLGKMNLEGLGTKMDKGAGIDYLRKAADAGRPMAMYYLGRSYSIGDGVTQDAAQAVKWYEQSALLGNHYGQYYLGQAKANGQGTTADLNQAIHWYERAAQQGHRVGFTKLINDTVPTSPLAIYARGLKLMQGKEYDAALTQFKALEKTNKAEAKAMQGLIYLNTDYTKHNDKKGYSLVKEAAKSGNPMGLYLTGRCLIDATGTKADAKQGVEYIAQAAKAGCPEAMEYLAEIYFEGRLADQNYAEAARWYGEAAKRMTLSGEALRHYASILDQGMGGVEPDKEKAAELLKSKEKDLLPDMLGTIIVTDAK